MIYLSSMLYLPLNTQSKEDIDWYKRQITVNDFFTGTDVYCGDDSVPGYIGIPRSFGLLNCAAPDKYCIPRLIPCPELYKTSIKARNAEQKSFMESIANICNEDGPVDYVANAATGSGKSFSALWVIAQLGVPAIVIVHTNKLARQWQDNVKVAFGEDWARDYLGHVQQDVCDYQNKRIVIGLLPSLAKRDYGKDFYDYFGNVIADEVHKFSVPFMSRVLKLFPARVRGGYTATNKSGALRKICDLHLGPPRVISTQTVMQPKVFRLDVKSNIKINQYSSGTIVNSLASNDKRNRFIVDLIISRGIKNNRKIIVLSDRVSQLYSLYYLLAAKGHGEATGVHAAQVYTGKYRGRIKLNNRYKTVCTGNSPADVRSTFQSMVKEGLYAAGTKLKIEQEILHAKPEDMDAISKTCDVILATYGTFDTGINEPRLDMGIEATPRSNVVQAMGRILRVVPDKATPEWYSLNDVTVTPCDHLALLAAGRAKSFSKHNAKVKVIPFNL